ncbi:MAG: M56 family metallopeptidase, partial [Planctomycetota bacterium]
MAVSLRNAAPWLAGLYAAGVSLMLLRLAGNIARAERLRRRSRLATDGALVDALRRLSDAWSLRVMPTLATAEDIVVPKVVGLAKPTILMPASALTGLSPGELEMILAHELAHVRRYDLWINLVQRLAEAALFFNPALWLLSRRISTLREYCCDELACGASQQRGAPAQLRYAQALLRIVELGEKPSQDRSTVAVLAATGGSPSELRRRVARLFGEPLREPLQVSRGGLVATLVLLSMLCSSALWRAQADTASVEIDESDLPFEEKRESEQDAPEPGLASSPGVPAKISGKIVLEDGSQAEAKGWLYSDSTIKVGKHSGSSTASTEGQFSDAFSCEVPAGTVLLSYFPEDYAPAWAGPFELRPGQELDDVTITLRPGFSVRLILQGDEGQRVPGATVVSQPIADRGIHGPVHEQQTDDIGELLLKYLADKKYQFTITAAGYQPLRTAPLRVAVGETLRLTMVRSNPAQGIVRFADGTPTPHTKLRVLREWRKNGKSIAFGSTGKGFWGKVLTTTDGR